MAPNIEQLRIFQQQLFIIYPIHFIIIHAYARILRLLLASYFVAQWQEQCTWAMGTGHRFDACWRALNFFQQHPVRSSGYKLCSIFLYQKPLRYIFIEQNTPHYMYNFSYILSSLIQTYTKFADFGDIFRTLQLTFRSQTSQFYYF